MTVGGSSERGLAAGSFKYQRTPSGGAGIKAKLKELGSSVRFIKRDKRPMCEQFRVIYNDRAAVCLVLATFCSILSASTMFTNYGEYVRARRGHTVTGVEPSMIACVLTP